MLDVRLFKDRRFGVSSIGMTLVFLTMFGFFFVVSQLFQLVLGYGPFESGLRMLPIMPVMIIFSTRAAGLVERFGARTIVTIGMLLTAGGVFILSSLDRIVRLRPRADRNVRDGIRHGSDDDTDDRADHVVGAPRQGRRRLGDERHHSRGRHDLGRRRPRQHPVVGLHIAPRQRGDRASRRPHGTRRRVRWPVRSASPARSVAHKARPSSTPPSRRGPMDCTCR